MIPFLYMTDSMQLDIIIYSNDTTKQHVADACRHFPRVGGSELRVSLKSNEFG